MYRLIFAYNITIIPLTYIFLEITLQLKKNPAIIIISEVETKVYVTQLLYTFHLYTYTSLVPRRHLLSLACQKSWGGPGERGYTHTATKQRNCSSILKYCILIPITGWTTYNIGSFSSLCIELILIINHIPMQITMCTFSTAQWRESYWVCNSCGPQPDLKTIKFYRANISHSVCYTCMYALGGVLLQIKNFNACKIF